MAKSCVAIHFTQYCSITIFEQKQLSR